MFPLLFPPKVTILITFLVSFQYFCMQIQTRMTLVFYFPSAHRQTLWDTALTFFHVTTHLEGLSYHNPLQASLGFRTEANMPPSVLHPITALPSSLFSVSLPCTYYSSGSSTPGPTDTFPLLRALFSQSPVSHLDVTSESCP